MNLNKLPLEIRTKIKANLNKIKTLNSSELLDYSKALSDSKDEIDTKTRDFLFNAIAERTAIINSGQKEAVKNKED